MGLADFGLPCTLFMNFYASHSVFYVKFVKNLNKTMIDEPSAISSHTPRFFVWPCRQILNAIHTIFC